MPGFSLFTLLSGIVLVLFTCGLHHLLTSQGDRPCEMTYMYEYPQFVKIEMPEPVTKNYHRYGLYAYSEGQHTDAVRKMRFTGIPVLFIPGSAGSYKQVRSIASVSLRKALNSRLPFHMDFFAVDLNEEYSGLYGGLLEVQTRYVRHAILRILQLYNGNKGIQPTSVVIFGHSMGGLIAKGLFNDASFDSDVVQVIITLATPHNRPVILFDEYLSYYYVNTSQTWHARRSLALSNITLASIGGGSKDLLVQTNLIASREIDMHTVTTTIPTVWRSVDHLCIMWCKELVLVLVRSLFDMVDPKTRQITTDKNLRRSVLTYHLLKRNSGKRHSTSLNPRFVTFQEGGEWIEPLVRQLTITANIKPNGEDRLSKTKNVMIRLIDHPHHALLAVEAINQDANDWVFVCNANNIVKDFRTCVTGENLSNATMLWPSLRHKRKRVVLDLIKLQQQQHFSHVILTMPLTTEPILFHIDVHANRILKPPAIGLWTLLDPRPVVLVAETAKKALRYEIDFSEIQSAWHALHLVVKPLSCNQAEHHAVAMLVVPWSNERLYSFINEKRQDPLLVRLLHIKPDVPKDTPPDLEARMSVKAEVSLDPACTYTISVEAAPGLLLSQLVRFYAPGTLAFVVAVLLLTLREQVRSMIQTGRCSLFHLALSRGAKPYIILPICKILTKFLSWKGEMSGIHTILNMLNLPEPSMNILAISPWEHMFVPLYLYAFAYGLVYVMGLMCMFGVVFSGKIVHKATLSVIGRSLKGIFSPYFASISDVLLEGFIRVPILLVGIIFVTNSQSCGAVGLIVCTIFQFLLMCKLYEDYLEALYHYAIKVVTGAERISLQGLVNPAGAGEHSDKIEKQIDPTKNGGDSSAEGKVKNDAATLSNSGTKSEAPREVQDEKEESRNFLSDINVHMTIFLLLLSCLVAFIPALLVWARNYKYDSRLDPDPSLPIASLILIALGGCFWLPQFPNCNLPCFGFVGESLFVISIFTIVYAPTRITVIPPIITIVMVVFLIHHWIATFYSMLRSALEYDVNDDDNGDGGSDSLSDSEFEDDDGRNEEDDGVIPETQPGTDNESKSEPSGKNDCVSNC